MTFNQTLITLGAAALVGTLAAHAIGALQDASVSRIEVGRQPDAPPRVVRVLPPADQGRPRPSQPILGQLWIDTSENPPLQKFWNGARWIPTHSVPMSR